MTDWNVGCGQAPKVFDTEPRDPWGHREEGGGQRGSFLQGVLLGPGLLAGVGGRAGGRPGKKGGGGGCGTGSGAGGARVSGTGSSDGGRRGVSQGAFSCSWSFVWSTLGVTAIAFVAGALGFWAPRFLFEARVVHGLQPPCLQEPCSGQDR